MKNRHFLYYAAGFGFFMAACQMIISIFPSAAAYFEAPPELLEDRWRLFIIGGSVSLLFVVGALYALSGAGSIRHLPFLRTILIIISVLFTLRGLSLIRTMLVFLGVVKGEILTAAWISSVVFLLAGIAYSLGTILNWRVMKIRRLAV